MDVGATMSAQTRNCTLWNLSDERPDARGEDIPEGTLDLHPTAAERPPGYLARFCRTSGQQKYTAQMGHPSQPRPKALDPKPVNGKRRTLHRPAVGTVAPPQFGLPKDLRRWKMTS